MREHDKTAVEHAGDTRRGRPTVVPLDRDMTHPLPGRADESAGEHHGGEALLEMLRRAECAPGSEVLGRLSELLGPPQRTEAPADGQTTSGASRTMALSADRGIINTGCVHGGQHVTDVKVAGDYVRGADDGI